MRIADRIYTPCLSDQLIEISEPSSGHLIAALVCYSPEKGHFYGGLSHAWGDLFYFCLSNLEDQTKDLYVFNAAQQSIACIREGLKDPNFIEDRLVEFGPGCNDDDLSNEVFEGTIQVFKLAEDLAEIIRYTLPAHQRGWICTIDSVKKIIVAKKAFSNESLEFSIFSEASQGTVDVSNEIPSPILPHSESEEL